MRRLRYSSYAVVWLIICCVYTWASSCIQYCLTESGNRTELPCEVHESVFPRIDGINPRPPPSLLHLRAQCFANNSRFGLGIEWQIQWKALRGEEKVEQFQLLVSDQDGASNTMTAYLIVTPNSTEMGCNNKVQFRYFYSGENREVGPEIVDNVLYKVTLKSMPIAEPEPGIRRNQTDEITKTIKIATNFKERNCVPDSTTHSMSNSTLVAITTDDSKVNTLSDVQWFMVVCIVIGLILLVAVVGFAAYKCKQQQKADTAANSLRAQNVLILLNLEDRAEVTRQTNWAATALSRARGLGKITIKYNRWETADISDIGIVRWMERSIRWADRVIISSIPDELRNEQSARVFERAFENMMTSQSVIDDAESPEHRQQVFVIHFQETENYQRCPFINNPRHRKFYLDHEWAEFCRAIKAVTGSEHEPLQNGNVV